MTLFSDINESRWIDLLHHDYASNDIVIMVFHRINITAAFIAFTLINSLGAAGGMVDGMRALALGGLTLMLPVVWQLLNRNVGMGYLVLRLPVVW